MSSHLFNYIIVINNYTCLNNDYEYLIWREIKIKDI